MLLLRVELPNVPGSLGRLATAIGAAGGDIEALEIVEKRADGIDVDDVLLDMVDGTMPDSVVSACNGVEGVKVLWISRYLAGGNLFPDLEVVESLTADPSAALDSLITVLPVAFRCEWGARVAVTDPGLEIERASEGAPSEIDLVPGEALGRQELGDPLAAIPPAGHARFLVLGRCGGPDFFDSPLARLGPLV